MKNTPSHAVMYSGVPTLTPMNGGLGFILPALLTAIITFRWTLLAYPHTQQILLRIVSCVLLVCCASTFQLILCEVLQTGDQTWRVFLWKFNTVLLLVILGFLAPLIQIVRFFNLKFPRLRLFSLVVFGIYLFLFQFFSLKLPIERYVSNDNIYALEDKSMFDLRQDSLACISFIGITTMALLCGISSVNAPYSFFIFKPTIVSEVDEKKLERSILSIKELISAKELEISKVQLEIKPAVVSAHPSFMQRIVQMVKPDSKQAELNSLMMELDALKKLVLEVNDDLETCRDRIRQQQFDKTLLGKLRMLCVCVFSVYCVYRVLNSYIRIWWYVFSYEVDVDKTGPKDALVLLIATYLNKIVPNLEVLQLTRIIGVFMSGAVFAAALNGVLRTAVRIVRHINRGASLSKIPLDVLFVGQVVGVYVLSIATTLRFNLPKDMSGPIMHALVSPLKVSSVQLWNDMVLCVTSTVMMVVLFVTRKLDEEMFDEERL